MHCDYFKVWGGLRIYTRAREILTKCNQKYILESALHYVLKNLSDYIFFLYLPVIPDF
jgi:hypothetical protein